MDAEAATHHVSPTEIRYGDVIQDPTSGRWITVRRIVAGEIRVSERVGPEERAATLPTWRFYGDERLDEMVAIDSEDSLVAKRV